MRYIRGFTLTELIIVIAILAILAAVFIPQMIVFINESQQAVCQANRAQILRQYAYRHMWQPIDNCLTKK